MKVTVKGQSISLSKNDFLGQGGEGSVYAKGKTAYKIYIDPKKMIPEEKINELLVLKNPKIINPQDVIYSRNKQIGYTMRYINKNKSYTLCELFTKSFKERHKLDNDMCLNLVRDMQNTVSDVHSHKILIVDLNELNFLIDNKFKDVYFIDVDSYQTQNYPAPALMESVRDRHNKTFSEGTDWFSFAVVAFQLLIGIHPYKGRHKTVKGLENRMQQNISVFNDEVSLPKCCAPVDVIPIGYRDWFKAVFEKGLRQTPPDDITKAHKVDIVQTVIISSKHLKIEQRTEPKFLNVGYYKNQAIKIQIDQQNVLLSNVTSSKPIDTSHIQAEQYMIYAGNIYIKTTDKINRLVFFGNVIKPSVTIENVCNVMEKATQLYPGVAMSNMLGSWYAFILPSESDSSTASCFQYKLDELNGYRVIEAKYDYGVLMIVGFKNGKYDRFIFTLDDKQVRVAEDIQYTGLNFVTLKTGVCICINEEEQLEIFHKKDINKIKLIEDTNIHSGVKLYSEKNIKLSCIENGSHYNVSMK